MVKNQPLKMSIACRVGQTKSSESERVFCRALLNHENVDWEDYEQNQKRVKRGFRLPPEDFVYGIKHPKGNGITGVAAALQYDETQNNPCWKTKTSKTMMTPDFIRFNKIAARLGLTKVSDIHHYRKTMQEDPTNMDCCPKCPPDITFLPDVIYGRPPDAQQSIRDVLEHKYLHDWLEKMAIRRCKEILNEPSCGKKSVKTKYINPGKKKTCPIK